MTRKVPVHRRRRHKFDVAPDVHGPSSVSLLSGEGCFFASQETRSERKSSFVRVHDPSGCCHGKRVHNENKIDCWVRCSNLSGQLFEGTDPPVVLLLPGKEHVLACAVINVKKMM
jgi:hypothetical protein